MTSPASLFTLEEYGVQGTDIPPKVSLTLTNRALPYTPLVVSGRQRAEFTWYPGSPQATVQMLGPEEGVITFRGYWKEKFLSAANDAENNNSKVATTSGLVDLVDRMRRSGRVIRMGWDRLVRYGHITNFTQTWHNSYDCEWEIEFSVISQTPIDQVQVDRPPVNIAAVAQSAANANAKVAAVGDLQPQNDPAISYVTPTGLTAAAGPSANLRVAPTVVSPDTWYQRFADTVATWAFNINSAVQQAVAFITEPARAAQNILSISDAASSVILETINGVTTTAQSYGAVVDKAMTEYYLIAAPLGIVQQDDVPLGVQVSNRNWTRIVQRAARDIIYSNAYTADQYTQWEQSNNMRVYTTPRDMDMRDISQEFYGTQDNWVQLMVYNGLSSSRLPMGYQVIIPSRAELASTQRA